MSIITDMGVRGFGNEILQPQHKNRWKLEFVGMGGNDEALTLMAISADRPKLSFEEIVLDRYNSRSYLAGKYSFETMTTTFEPDLGGRVAEIIRTQLDRQQKIIGMTSSPTFAAAPIGRDYKFGLRMDLLDGNAGEAAVIESWLIEGCWLMNVDWGDLDYAASETIKIATTIRYDHARQDIRGYDGVATGAPML